MVRLSFHAPCKTSCKMFKKVGNLCPGQGISLGTFFPDFWCEPCVLLVEGGEG